MLDSVATIGTITYGMGALAFGALSIPLVASWRGLLQGGLLGLAAIVTSLWCGAVAWTFWSAPGLAPLAVTLELVRDAVWIAFLWTMMAPGTESDRRPWPWRGAVVLPGLVLGILAFLGIQAVAASLASPGASYVPLYLRLALAVLGLVLTESLYRNTAAEMRWHIKFLCLATGGMFVYDLFLYADAVLFRHVNTSFLLARGAVQALVVPLLMVSIARSKVWKVNIHVSRQVALHSTTLVAGGAYLFLVAAAGFYLREMGGAWGPVFQILYMFGAAVLLAVVLFSGTVRSYLKVLIARHFYSHKYDYRDEWLRFMRTLAAEHGAAPIEERAIKAIADIVDSPAGAMWLLDGNRYNVAASWNLDPPSLVAPRGGGFVRFLETRQWVIDIGEAASQPGRYEGLSLPEELAGLRQAWLVVPLWLHGLIGFVLLARPRSPRKLGWEDYDLLKTVGRQAASYLAEKRASQALDEAREFEIFNRRFAFVIHDIKNLVSQLSLGATNLEKHGDDPAFREDMARTVNDATEKMKRLIGRINAIGGDAPSANEVPLKPLIDEIAAGRRGGPTRFEVISHATDVAATGDRDRISTVVQHLVQNAVEAAGAGGTVSIALRRSDGSAIIDVIDDGPGMARDFVRDELFKPFQSSKYRGMGIGAFQCREYVREMGGDIEAISEPGRGTTMRIALPLATGREHGDKPTMPAGAT